MERIQIYNHCQKSTLALVYNYSHSRYCVLIRLHTHHTREDKKLKALDYCCVWLGRVEWNGI